MGTDDSHGGHSSHRRRFLQIGVAAGSLTFTGTGKIGAEEPDGLIKITDWNDLDQLRDHWRESFELASDLDSDSEGYNTLVNNRDGGWKPIDSFRGTLTGNGYTIADLIIDRPNEDRVGLFESFAGDASSFTLADIKVVGANRVGGITGRLSGNGHLKNITVRGIISGESRIGGIAGTNLGSVSDSISTASVEGSDERVGGLIGNNSSSAVLSQSGGEVTVDGGDRWTGGAIGINFGTVSKVSTSGSVRGDTRVGGVVGTNQATIEASDTDATVKGNERVGGFAGINFTGEVDGTEYTGVITESEAEAQVDGTDERVGGFVGQNSGTLENVQSGGEVSGKSRVGGLIGNNSSGAVLSQSSGEVTVDGGDQLIGGAVGINFGTVSESEINAQIDSSGERIGGFAGQNQGEIEDVETTADISGGRVIGGLIGKNLDLIHVATASGFIEGAGTAGGLVGHNLGGTVEEATTDIVIDSDPPIDPIAAHGQGDLIDTEFEGEIIDAEHFEVQMLSAPESVLPGDTLPIHIEIANTGYGLERTTADIIANNQTIETVSTKLSEGEHEELTSQMTVNSTQPPEQITLTVQTEHDERQETITVESHPDEEPSDTPPTTSEDNEDESDSIPGFGIVGTLSSFGGAAYLLKRRLAAQKSDRSSSSNTE